MDRQQFVTKIRRLHPTQSVTIRFAETGMMGLMRLSSLLRNDSRVHLVDKDKVIMTAVLMSGWWEGSLNRNYTVYGLSQADDGWLYEISKDVESIELAEHGAKGIMSGRQKMQREAVQKIVGEVLTHNFVKEMADWGMSVADKFGALEGLPFVSFTLSYGEVTVTSAAIDGWSGRIAINGKFGNECYICPDQIQMILRSQMESMLEKITSAA